MRINGGMAPGFVDAIQKTVQAWDDPVTGLSASNPPTPGPVPITDPRLLNVLVVIQKADALLKEARTTMDWTSVARWILSSLDGTPVSVPLILEMTSALIRAERTGEYVYGPEDIKFQAALGDMGFVPGVPSRPSRDIHEERGQETIESADARSKRAWIKRRAQEQGGATNAQQWDQAANWLSTITGGESTLSSVVLPSTIPDIVELMNQVIEAVDRGDYKFNERDYRTLSALRPHLNDGVPPFGEPPFKPELETPRTIREDAG
jgi:hypothetical protein